MLRAVRRILIIAGIALAVLLVASQLALPSLAERRVEDRLTEGGGEAEASVTALPAARLLFGDGDSFRLEASALDLELDRETEVFERLDGFGEVEIGIEDFRAGPFTISSFGLDRDGDGPYRLVTIGETSGAALADYGVERLGLPGFAAVFLGASNAAVPIELEMELMSADGEIEVTAGGGTVAGVPAGPLAELITAAIVERL
jgi:hypothetical protein